MMTGATTEEVAVAVCAVRPFDRAALAAVCHLDPRLSIRCSTAEAAELVGLVGASEGPMVVLLGVRALREAGGSVLVDQLHATAAQPRILLAGTDEHASDLVAISHADAYLRLDGDVADQLARIFV